MINDGQVYLAGYVASPPVFKITGGKSNTTVRVAFTPRWVNRETGEWSDGPTSFVNVLCWRGLADNVAVSLRKGEPVLVMGRLRVRRYQDREGAPRIAVEVEASSVGHDLSRGVTAFSRTRRAPVESAAEGNPATGEPGPDGTVLAADLGGEGQVGPGEQVRSGLGNPEPECGAGDQVGAARDGEGPADGGQDDGEHGGSPGGISQQDGDEQDTGPELDDRAVAELARQIGEPLDSVAVPF